jgi:tripartite-type tricarboxylate transporter receptor subunit TctC
MTTRRTLIAGALAAAAALPMPSARAQNFPSKPINFVVPWPAGGSVDRHMRVLADLAGKHLGQPIVIDNKPGAAGTLGPATVAASAKPDGYTIVQMPLTMFRFPYMQKVSFDPKKDFTYIMRLSGNTLGTSVLASSPWQTWKEFLAYAKANPGKIRYGTPGTGSTLHITMEQIARQQGIQWTQVPFRGEAEILAALLGEHIEAAAAATAIAPLVEAGKARMLVVWTEQRSPRFPTSPTLMEEGHNLVSASPYGLAGPRGMDPKIVKIIHDAFFKAMADPAHQKVLDELSQPAMYLNTADYEKYVQDTIEEQQILIKELGLAAK